jgi:hypothetical protein
MTPYTTRTGLRIGSAYTTQQRNPWPITRPARRDWHETGHRVAMVVMVATLLAMPFILVWS